LSLLFVAVFRLFAGCSGTGAAGCPVRRVPILWDSDVLRLRCSEVPVLRDAWTALAARTY